MKRKNLAFSMAEVMITLVILGVIAMITVPQLIDSSSKRVNDAAVSKADYTVSQAALRLQSECPRLRCTNDAGNNISAARLADLLVSVNANSMLTYNVSSKSGNFIYVLATIDGDDIPLLYTITNSGIGARAKSTEVAAAFAATWDIAKPATVRIADGSETAFVSGS